MTRTVKQSSSNRSLLQKYAAAPHIVWAVLFIVAPLLFVAYYAFTDGNGGFTFAKIALFLTLTELKNHIYGFLFCITNKSTCINYNDVPIGMRPFVNGFNACVFK